MNQTKYSLLVLVFLLSFNANAQIKVTNILGISPSITNTLNAADPPFPILVDVNYFGDNTSIYFETMKEPKFNSFFIPIAYAKEISNNYFVSIGFGFGLDHFTSELSYFYWPSGQFGTQEFLKEEVKADKTLFYMNIGKAFYFNTEKKLLFMPFIGVFTEAYWYDRTLSYYGPSISGNARDSYGYNLKDGVNIGLILNYQFTKHFGIGLNFNDVIKIYKLNYKKDNSAEEINRKQIEFNLNQAPRISLLYYFKSKPGLFY